MPPISRHRALCHVASGDKAFAVSILIACPPAQNTRTGRKHERSEELYRLTVAHLGNSAGCLGAQWLYFHPSGCQVNVNKNRLTITNRYETRRRCQTSFVFLSLTRGISFCQRFSPVWVEAPPVRDQSDLRQ